VLWVGAWTWSGKRDGVFSVNEFDNWPRRDRLLVERAFHAHGGLDSWNKVQTLLFEVKDVSGWLFTMKGLGHTFSFPEKFEVHLHKDTVICPDYPLPGQQGRYQKGSVVIKQIDSGTTILESPDHRTTFNSWRKYRRWTPLDALYFFGYAVLHYHQVPFTLPQTRWLRSVESVKDGPGMEVEFPNSVITHCRKQRFYFGQTGLISRHDYTADVVSGMATGAHYWQDYQTVADIQIAGRRKVLVQTLGTTIPSVVLDVRFSSISAML
jgi:hypothetical protein